MNAPEANDAVARLEAALAFDARGVVRGALDVIGLIDEALLVRSAAREELWRRLYLEAPLPYWPVARWAMGVGDGDLPRLLAATRSTGWGCVARAAAGDPPPVADVLGEVAERFDRFDPDLFPWEYGAGDAAPPQLHKYLLGRELARSYVAGAAGAPRGRAARTQLLLERQEGWSEWVRLNAGLGYSAAAASQGTSLALDHAMARGASAAAGGVGRTHILLEQLSVAQNQAIGVLTAEILPVEADHHHLDGLIVPDLRENGLLLTSDEFLAGVATAWRYVRESLPRTSATLLVFSIRPAAASVVQQLSGRSAELAVLAAIESSARKRALRPNAAASATLTLYGPDGALRDPQTGPASFEQKKYLAALVHRMATVVVHTDVARQWRRQNPAGRNAGNPDVVASDYYRRDALPSLETRSLWRMGLTVPAAVSAALAGLAVFWQLYKLSASPIAPAVVEPQARLPLVPTALLAVELGCLAISLFIVQLCLRSIRASLDSRPAAWLALACCALLVLAAQFLPVGVRAEGLLDNPLYSVLFGEPQLHARDVLAGGGGGFLALHTASQTAGFVTILLGVSAFVIRLLQARAHSEPHFDDRCALIHNDWRFSVALMTAFLAMVAAFGLPRNALWYYYLSTLPGVALIDNGGSLAAVVAPLIGICVVITFAVGVVWLLVLRAYLVRVVAAAHGRSGYTPADVVTRLPPLARALYAIGSAE